MKQIIALQEYTDKHVSLYEGEIRNIGNNLADELIAKGIVAEHNETSPDNEKGYSVEQVWEKIYDDTVTTQPLYSDNIVVLFSNYSPSPSMLRVTVDGETYILPKHLGYADGAIYGSSDETGYMNHTWSEYPFFIMIYSSNHDMVFLTKEAGTYNLIVEAKTLQISTTEDFSLSVENVVKNIPPEDVYIINLNKLKTQQQIAQAYEESNSVGNIPKFLIDYKDLYRYQERYGEYDEYHKIEISAHAANPQLTDTIAKINSSGEVVIQSYRYSLTSMS